MTGSATLDRRLVSALGVLQIVGYGSTYYLPAVLAPAIAADTGWKLTWIVGGFSLGLLAAGVVSPAVGRAIEARGGRPVLAASAALMGIGLVALGLAPTMAAYVAAWLVIGVGMGAGLYEAAFATLGLIYGLHARSAITILTLFGGFASTVCWPLSAFLLETLGWRATCFAYAALHLGLSLPLYLLVLPRAAPVAASPPSSLLRDAPPKPSLAASAERRILFALLAVILTASAAITAIVSVHLLTILQARDMTLAAAVALGTLIGPSQVAARWAEMLIGRRFHPIWTLVAAVLLMAAGLAALATGLPMLGFALVVYGGGLGIESIARGTVPLALFGAPGYAVLMGRLAMPSLLAQALAPAIGALLLDSLGVPTLMAVLAVLAVANIGGVLLLLPRARAAGAAGSLATEGERRTVAD